MLRSSTQLLYTWTSRCLHHWVPCKQTFCDPSMYSFTWWLKLTTIVKLHAHMARYRKLAFLYAQNVIGSRISCLTLKCSKGMDEQVVLLCKHITDRACSATPERFPTKKYEYAWHQEMCKFRLRKFIDRFSYDTSIDVQEHLLIPLDAICRLSLSRVYIVVDTALTVLNTAQPWNVQIIIAFVHWLDRLTYCTDVKAIWGWQW